MRNRGKNGLDAVTSFSTVLPEASRDAETPTMSAPASASPKAMDLPMPRLQPVTRAVLPDRLNWSSMLMGDS